MNRYTRFPRYMVMSVVLWAAAQARADVRELWDLSAIRSEPLDVKVLEEKPGLDVTFPHRRLHLTYRSQTWRGKDIRIEAFVVIPVNPKGRIPAVLSLHGHGGAGSEGDAAAKAKDFRGVGMSISGPGQGKSTGRRDATAHWIDADKDVRNSFMYQYPYAAMRAITYLTSLPQVDPKRIGVIGGSMGAMCTIIVNGLDSRVAAAVPVSGCGSYEPEMRAGKTWFSRLILDALQVKMEHPGVQAFLKYLDPIHYAPTQHGPCLLVCGAQDEPFPITCLARTFVKMPPQCRLNIVYDADHGGFTKPDTEFTMYDNREQWGRRVFGSAMWWLHHYLDEPKPGQARSKVPETPKLSTSLGKENTVTFSLQAGTCMPIRRVLLCWSLDGSYTFQKAVMNPSPSASQTADKAAYALSVVLHQGERDTLCAFAEVEYPDNMFLTCVPFFGPKFDVKVRQTKFGIDMYRREMSTEDAIGAFRKEIANEAVPLPARLWKEYQMGRFLRALGRPQEALEAYDDVIKRGEGLTKDTLVPSALYQQAEILHEMGQDARATANLKRAIELYGSCKDLDGKEIPRAKALMHTIRRSAKERK